MRQLHTIRQIQYLRDKWQIVRYLYHRGDENHTLIQWIIRIHS